MGGGSQAKDHPYSYLCASSLSAMINYPLWRASAIGQSGFRIPAANFNIPLTMKPFVESIPVSFRSYIHAFAPPYKGMVATIAGMTWARAAIFWGSDIGKDMMEEAFPTLPSSVVTLTPPLITSIFVQCINQPVVRASITLQNPESNMKNIRESIRFIYAQYGISGLWHGTSAGILKTVPKYCTAIIVKDYMDGVLPQIDPQSSSANSDALIRSAYKSATAGLAGAVLTNPCDVVRNEMFKTNLSLMDTVTKLRSEMGWKFMWRGMGKNLVAVSIPVASTIFFTDIFIQYNQS
jgi:hypothetical protein